MHTNTHTYTHVQTWLFPNVQCTLGVAHSHSNRPPMHVKTDPSSLRHTHSQRERERNRILLCSKLKDVFVFRENWGADVYLKMKMDCGWGSWSRSHPLSCSPTCSSYQNFSAASKTSPASISYRSPHWIKRWSTSVESATHRALLWLKSVCVSRRKSVDQLWSKGPHKKRHSCK